MQCRTHPTANGVNTCHQCGDWLCDECTVEINGRIYCRKCLAQLAGAPTGTTPPPPPPHMHYRAPVHGRYVSGGILALLTICLPIPGVNYMYEGLIKRGLAAMGGFFMLIYALSIFSFWPFSLIFGLSIPIFWLACFFDSIRIRRRINAGENVADDIDDIVAFIKRYKVVIITALAIVVGMSVFGSLFSALSYPIRRFLPLIVVVGGLFLMFRRPRK